jgi:hypothetical protein
METSQKKTTFWKSLFSLIITNRQNIFDVVFGVIAPVLCLVFDPFVFTGMAYIYVGSFLASYRIFFYLAISFGIVGLIVWLVFSRKLNSQWNSYFIGVLFLGALLAFALGLLLLPFSLIGINLLIGIFGFTPFLTGFVYLRNGIRASKKNTLSQKSSWIIIILGITSILTIPTFVQWKTSQIVSHGTELILSGNKESVEIGIKILKNAYWCNNSCYDGIVNAYSTEEDSERRLVLANSYQELSGLNIESLFRNIFQIYPPDTFKVGDEKH